MTYLVNGKEFPTYETAVSAALNAGCDHMTVIDEDIIILPSMPQKSYRIDSSLFDRLREDGVTDEMALAYAYAICLNPDDVIRDYLCGDTYLTARELSGVANANYCGDTEPDDYDEAMEDDPYAYLWGMGLYFANVY